MKTMLTAFQCSSLSKNCFLATVSVLTVIIIADCKEIEAGHAKKIGKRIKKNWKDEEIEMLITLYWERSRLWDASHKDYMKRDSKEAAVLSNRFTDVQQI